MIKTALITGAGTGIGKACAHEMMLAGYHVIFTGRRLGVLQAAMSEVDGSAEAIACDISDADAVAALYAGIEKNQRTP